MPDLRRQVLESGKTISRKAASREGSRRTSRTNSAQNSRHSSRNASRQASDDEDAGYLSDETAMRSVLLIILFYLSCLTPRSPPHFLSFLSIIATG